ncbi:MAG: HD-GYP domain-containing protein [Gammaproteobacteria bacterium]|nr:HD-GYP domain-containing protein [Gammaproteobacteria bacterium]MDH5650283.1 HD-GYP domain-containing protein [Gammaproteobacteria bacterium]
MLKKIHTQQLKIGMHIHDLDADWMEHPFVSTRFTLDDQQQIDQIKAAGIEQVVIDTEKGLDCAGGETVDAVQAVLQETFDKPHAKKTVHQKQVRAVEEFSHARDIYREATQVIHRLMEDVRLGKQVELEQLEPVAEKIVSSVFRNKDALISLTRIKNRDYYTFMHCVSVSGLMSTFAHSQGMELERIKQIALGGLLHDIGKTQIPLEILNKPGKLTDAEFEVMKSHVLHGVGLLGEVEGLTADAIDVVSMHHERFDGSGYPRGLKGNEISMVGQMSMMVDVYDALTSVRCYKDAWEPSFTLKKLLEWSDTQFNRELVESYIRSLGIYPVGSLVQLQSGLVGIVMEQHESDLLRPDIRIIYNSRFEKYVQVKDVRLCRLPEDHIVQAVSPEKYHIDLAAFI